MNKRLIYLTFAAIIGLSGVVSAGDYSGGGAGTEAVPYRIATAADMNEIGANPDDWDAHFVLVNDVDLADYTGTEFNIIGDDFEPFTGVFDGNNHTIMKFTYCKHYFARVALFSVVDDQAAAVKNLIMTEADVNDAGSNCVACLVGILREGQISNCHIINGKVSAEGLSGLLVGASGGYSQISNCSASGISMAMVGAGGLVGSTGEHATITNCCSDANVIVEHGTAGGLVGGHGGDLITRCCSTGWVEGLGNSGRIGGLVGYNGSTIRLCYSSAKVIGGDDEGIGGLIGENYGNISKSFATGDVSGVIDVAGLVGYNFDDGVISDSYARGDVNAKCCHAGGLVSGNKGIIQRCYSTGTVVIDGNPGGGLISHDHNLVADSFWDIETSDCNTSDGGTARNTTQMQTASTFTDAGWDFVGEVVNGPNDIWRMCVDGLNYPMLWWEFIDGDFLCPDGVNFIDYSFFAGHWLEDNCAGSNDCEGSDLDQSGAVDINDVKIFAGNWLAGQIN